MPAKCELTFWKKHNHFLWQKYKVSDYDHVDFVGKIIELSSAHSRYNFEIGS